MLKTIKSLFTKKEVIQEQEPIKYCDTFLQESICGNWRILINFKDKKAFVMDKTQSPYTDYSKGSPLIINGKSFDTVNLCKHRYKAKAIRYNLAIPYLLQSGEVFTIGYKDQVIQFKLGLFKEIYMYNRSIEIQNVVADAING